MRFPRPSHSELLELLSITDSSELDALFKRAYEVKKQYIGTKVWFRGIIELSNICSKDCYYCGIRSSNTNVKRYTVSHAEVIKEARWCYEQGYGSIVLQSGERSNKAWIDQITDLIYAIKDVSDGKLGITISFGEQSKEVYKQWLDAGAHRYLLRVETSNPELYKKLHPQNHSFESRVKSLGYLKEVGYQVGTGVMMGLPGQTLADLANDVLFFYDIDVDMIGMGPFIPHKDTPFGHLVDSFDETTALQLGLKMIAVCRIFLRDINIASTTALQALKSDGRELGLLAGANIIMPNVTDTKFREGYQLYEGKPNLNENASETMQSLEDKITAMGETVAYGEWGDSAHFFKRTNQEKTL